MSQLRLRGLVSVLLVVCLQVTAPRADAVPFLIGVETSALQGRSGFLELQFNPATVGTPAALATVAGFGGNFDLLDAPSIEGNVSGTLPQVVQLRNGAAFNTYFQAVKFGSQLSFMVDFTGDFLTQPSLLGSSFSVGLLTSSSLPLLTEDASGSLLRFELQLGSVTFQAFQAGGRRAATVIALPSPATGSLLMVGALLLMGQRLRRDTV